MMNKKGRGFAGNVLIGIMGIAFLIFITSGGFGTIVGLTKLSVDAVQFLGSLPTIAWVIMGVFALIFTIAGGKR